MLTQRGRALGAVAICVGTAALSACGSCSKSDPGGDASSPAASAGSLGVVAEPLPRCRAETQRVTIGDDVMVGDVAISSSGLLVGLIRTEAGKRVASVMRAPLDLATSQLVDVGPSLGDDPPPSPRWNGASPFALVIGPHLVDGGVRQRALRALRLDEGGKAQPVATVLQQADESTAFDVAWTDNGAALAAWDEDAPVKDDAGAPVGAPPYTQRGFIKIQVLNLAGPGASEPGPRRVASPEGSDAESPRLVARPGGFWLAWLARRIEENEHHVVEGPGEKRAFRWVELVPLDTKGDPTGPVRRVTSEKGRAASFELARSANDVVVIVQDEAAAAEGSGSRIVRYLVGEKADKLESSDVVDGGVGQALAELVPVAAPAEGARWLAWNDVAERAHMTPLGPGLIVSGRTSSEPALDAVRVIAGSPPDVVFAISGMTSGSENGPNQGKPAHPELRRYVCK